MQIVKKSKQDAVFKQALLVLVKVNKKPGIESILGHNNAIIFKSISKKCTKKNNKMRKRGTTFPGPA